MTSLARRTGFREVAVGYDVLRNVLSVGDLVHPIFDADTMTTPDNFKSAKWVLILSKVMLVCEDARNNSYNVRLSDGKLWLWNQLVLVTEVEQLSRRPPYGPICVADGFVGPEKTWPHVKLADLKGAGLWL